MQSSAQPSTGGTNKSPMLSSASQNASNKLNELTAKANALPMTLDMLFFSAACCVIAAGIIGIIGAVAGEFFAIFDICDSIYLLLFGLVMFILDSPLRFKGLLHYQIFVNKYVRFLTLFTGRGLWYLFLGTLIFGSLWDNDIWPFGGFVLGLYVFLVGVFSTVIGIIKSSKLRKVKAAIGTSPEQLSNSFHTYARTNPELGLTVDEFNNMAGNVAGVHFGRDELGFVFNALTGGARGVTLKDLNDWTSGPVTLL